MGSYRFEGIESEGFLELHPRELQDSGGEKTLQQARLVLDQAIAKGEGRKGELGEVMRVFKWNARDMSMAVFDFVTGQQVGVSKAQLWRNPGVPPGHYVYETEYIIGTSFTHQGLATLARNFLKLFLASRIPGQTILMDTIEAQGADAIGVRKILERSGARERLVDTQNGPTQVWTEHLKVPSKLVPQSVQVQEIGFYHPTKESLVLGSELHSAREAILYGDMPVAASVGRSIFILPPGPDVLNQASYLKGVREVWTRSRDSGYRPILTELV